MISGLRWTGEEYSWNEKTKTIPHFPHEPLALPSQPTATFPKPRPIKPPQRSRTDSDAESSQKGSFSQFLQTSWDVPPPTPALPQLYNHLRPAALQARTSSPPLNDDDSPLSPGSEQLLTALVTCFATLTDNIRGLSDEVRALREERALASYSAVYTPNRNAGQTPATNGGGPSKTMYPPPANQPAPTLKPTVSWASQDEDRDEDSDEDDDMQATPTSPAAGASNSMPT